MPPGSRRLALRPDAGRKRYSTNDRRPNQVLNVAMIAGDPFREIEVTFIDWRVEGNEVIFFVKENGVDIPYAQDVCSYLNCRGKFDDRKVVRAILLAKLSGKFLLKIDNCTNKIIQVVHRAS